MKIEVINTNYPGSVPNGSIMTVINGCEDHAVVATIDGGDGFEWFVNGGTYRVIHDYEPTRDPEASSPYGDGNHPLPPMTGTLRELNVKPGDVVETVYNGIREEECSETKTINASGQWPGRGDNQSHGFRITSRASTYDPDQEVDQLRNERDALQAVIDGTPKTWGEMTDAEKGADLHADKWPHNGEWSNWFMSSTDGTIKNGLIRGKECEVETQKLHGCKQVAYRFRIKPEPKRETVTGWWNGKNFHNKGNYGDRTHRITFTTTDGEPDLDSIKMERV